MRNLPGIALRVQPKRSVTLPVIAALVIALVPTSQGQADTLPPARLSAKVVDARDEPIAEVTVTITHEKQSDYLKTKITNKRGKFHLIVQALGLFDDCFSLRFEAVGYQTQERLLGLTSGQSVRAVITLTRESGEEYHKQGMTAVLSRHYNVAEELFLKALNTQPGLTESRHALAELYLHQRRYAEAITSAENALVALPGTHRMLEILQAAHQALGNSEKAQDAFKALISAGAP